jgi:hypothetical protein
MDSYGSALKVDSDRNRLAGPTKWISAKRVVPLHIGHISFVCPVRDRECYDLPPVSNA